MLKLHLDAVSKVSKFVLAMLLDVFDFGFGELVEDNSIL